MAKKKAATKKAPVKKAATKKTTTATRKKATAKKPLTKTQIIAAIAEKTELSRQDVNAVFDALHDEIVKSLAPRGPGEITIPPGIIKVRKKKKKATPAGKRMNPFTKEMMTVKAKPASTKLQVRPLKKLKEIVEPSS
ncbi:Integration host factor [Planctomycetales bacterium 10988]|nr:Integration host factor [Planctomycetales bacterium 10988]